MRCMSRVVSTRRSWIRRWSWYSEGVFIYERVEVEAAMTHNPMKRRPRSIWVEGYDTEIDNHHRTLLKPEKRGFLPLVPYPTASLLEPLTHEQPVSTQISQWDDHMSSLLLSQESNLQPQQCRNRPYARYVHQGQALPFIPFILSTKHELLMEAWKESTAHRTLSIFFTQTLLKQETLKTNSCLCLYRGSFSADAIYNAHRDSVFQRIAFES